MADDALGWSIINLLQAQDNQCMELKDISKHLKIHKKQLNVELYRLKRQGVLNKVQDIPPVWQVTNSTSAGIYLPLRPRHSRKRYDKEFHRGGKIGSYRRGHTYGQKRRKKTTHNKELINSIIHFLQTKTDPVKTFDIARAVGKSTSSEINPSLYFLQKQNVAMKVLEKPVSWIINFDRKQPHSSVDWTQEFSNQKDVLLGQNSWSYETLNSNAEASDQETTTHFPGFGTMDTLDRSLATGNQNSPNIDIEGLNMNSPSHEVDIPFEEDDQNYDFQTPSFSDQMFGEGMELGGDNFGSEDNELSKSESDFHDSFLDSSGITEISQDAGATTSDIEISVNQNLSELQLPVGSNKNVTDIESSKTETNSTRESNTQETVNAPVSVQIKEDKSSPVLTEIDELLKTMLNCPMQTAKLFILETKLKYPPGKVEDLLKKCKEKKFVKFYDQLWIMTPSGVNYIKGKLTQIGQRTDHIKTYVVQSAQPSIPKSTKSSFKGPPPPPIELLQKENSVIQTSWSSSDTKLSHPSISHQNGGNLSVPQTLEQSTSPHNFINSVNQQSFSSSREPVPLMSLNFNSSPSVVGEIEKIIKSQIGLSDNPPSDNSFPLQVDNNSQSATPKPLMSIDTSPFSSKNVLLNKNELPGTYPVYTQAPGRYQGLTQAPGSYQGPTLAPGRHTGPTEAPGRYPGPGETPGRYPGPVQASGRCPGPSEAPGRYQGPSETPGRYQGPGETPGRHLGPGETRGRYPGPVQASGRYPGPSEAPGRYQGPAPGRYQGPGEAPGRYQGPNEAPGRYTGTTNIPERYPNSGEATNASCSGVNETDYQNLNLFSNRNEQINQIFSVPQSSESSSEQSSSLQDTPYLQCQTTGTNLQSMTDQSSDSGIVLPAGHTKPEHMPAFAKSIFESFSSGSTRFPTSDKMQQRKGISQPSTSGRLPFSSSNIQGSGTINKTTTTSLGFKPPPPPLDLIKQQTNESGNLHNTNVTPSSNIRQELARTAQQMIHNIPSVSSSVLQQQPTVSGQVQIQREPSQMSSDLTGQSQGQRLSHSHSMPIMGNVAPPRQKTGPLSLDLTSESFAAVNKNPVSALMEYAQSRHKVARIEVIRQSGPSHRPRFLMGVFIGDQQIAAVECSNKKDGRREVADKALRALIASGQYNMPSPSANKPLVPAANMTHFDKMAALSHQAFNALVAGISENFAGRKVIAALVMKCSDTDVGTVVSVGSGNRCITGQQLSLEGNTVNDSHAEIITRRGFIRFLYKRLLAYDPNNSRDMFEKAPSGKLRIRSGITFHLYISTAPCGDGALFSPRDVSSNSGPMLNINDRTHHPTFTSQAQGLVRTKMEGGEGTIPVEKDFVVQTFDGIQRGERLRTMSCTDKICRWNVVGMQGALLSHFLEPIYLDSLTLGLLYDHGHLARALCCRVAQGETNVDELLPRGYHLNHPWLGRVTACEPPREVQKTKALSINWCIGDERAEVTDGTLGLLYTKIEKGLFSRCSKKNLYDSFKKLCQKYGLVHLLQAKNYHETKMMATDFQAAKSAMLQKFKENGYGHWVSKPIEEELFS